ncbi:hypothetical protein BN1088_1431275 [Sphingobacterium sp. PM2-P1-29]|nr:hypothetical protein BN1088_1431275 [Sphingobacterium sp. PM2-P1-29]
MEEVVIIEPIQKLLGNSTYALVRHKPGHCKFPVIGTPWQVTKFPEIIISKQSRRLLGANMQLFEFDALIASSIIFRIIKPTAFLFFHLTGDITYFSSQGEILSVMNEPTFYLTFGPVQEYRMMLENGHHAILGIALDQVWSIYDDESYPAFDELYTAWHNNSNTPFILPQKQITKEVWKMLAELRYTVVKNINDNIDLLSQISDFLSLYHGLLIADWINPKIAMQTIGERIREHLLNNFMFEEECRLNRLREKFELTEWELRKIAEDTFGCSIGQYINKIRMEKAIELLIETRLTVNEITVKIGFNSPTNFTNIFRKKTGLSPTLFRKQMKVKPIEN